MAIDLASEHDRRVRVRADTPSTAPARARLVDRLLVDARWLAAGALLVQFALYESGVGGSLPFPRWPVAAALAATLATVNAVFLWSAHRWSPHALDGLGRAAVVVDGAVVIALLALFGFDTTARLWPLLVLPILEAGLRDRLRGALTAWLVGSASFVLVDLAWMRHRGAQLAVDVPGTTLAVLVLLVVTIAVGSLARELERARTDAATQADKLRELSRLSPSLSAVRDPETAVDELLHAALRLSGGEAARLFLHGPDGWNAAATAPADAEGPSAVLAAAVPASTTTVVTEDDGGRPLIAVPVALAGSRRPARLLIAGGDPDEQTPATMEALALLAAHAAVVIETAEVAAAEARTIHELRALDRAKDDFVSVLGHDLRSPMTTVAGYADLLQSRWDRVPQEQRLEFLAAISRATRRMSDLVEDVFDALSAEHAALPTQPSIVRLEPLLAEFGTQEVGRSPDHQLDLRIGAGAETVWADARRLGQVVANLLSNAVKYSPDGGPVGLVTRREGDAVVIEIQDEGLGIAPEDRKRLFGRFVRLHPDEGVPGTGLGLYLCHALVTAMEGEIEVDSAPGHGSTFAVRLPAVAPPSAAPYPAPAPGRVPAGLQTG